MIRDKTLVYTSVAMSTTQLSGRSRVGVVGDSTFHLLARELKHKVLSNIMLISNGGSIYDI